MGKSNIPEHVREQIKVMSRDDKTPKEIMQFVEKTYKIDLPYSTVYSIIKARSKHKKKGKVVLKDPREDAGKIEDIGKILEEIRGLVDELQGLYIDNLKAIRVQLMAAVQKSRNIA